MKLPFFSFADKPTQTLGQYAEDETLKYLKREGLKLIQRNYSCKYGEIDLIMLDNDLLVFIEVRYRKSNRYGSSAESVTASKQKKIITTAQHFIHMHQSYQSYACRFDVTALSPHLLNKHRFEIDWIKNAFFLET